MERVWKITRAQLERRSALDKLSRKERAIREFLYYPDGKTRVRTMRLVADLDRDKMRRLAEALLDKHNDAEVRPLAPRVVSDAFPVHCDTRDPTHA
jgi:hypothetical protein